ncbi:RRQRL motif-containing zinc-binding protein [Umezawaea beigongshangensis]|uniref:RRQRL motif-containing zinc-binding protein n=1 Tax=Umezawaea beigongshangensis TaxID=2780383 RepID=UPI0018F265A6|nr:RRQRL motif-containing zinc-binding protein [Umezawaea beigongshangensis]
MSGLSRPICEVVLPWNGQGAFCRGREDGLLVFAWRGRPGAVPPGLATRRQLRAAGLRPNGQGAQALLWFRHRWPFRREELAELFLVALAAPVRPMTAGRVLSLDAAMRARRTCRTCHQVADHVVRGPRRQCSACFSTDTNDFEPVRRAA